MRPEVDHLQVDALWPQVVEQVAQEDSIPKGLSQIEYLRGLPCHSVASWKHLAVDQPQRALPPILHHDSRLRRLRDPPAIGPWADA